MEIALTVSICLNVFQAVMFWLVMAGIKAREKQIKDACEQLKDVLDEV